MKKILSLLLTLTLIIGLIIIPTTVTASTTYNLDKSDIAYFIDFDKAPAGSGYALSSDKWGVTDKAVTISFDYVLKDASDKEIKLQSGGVVYDFADDTTGSAYLKKGEHTFTFTTDKNLYDAVYLTVINASETESNADLYIWNISVIVDGNEITDFNANWVTNTNVSFSIVPYEEVMNIKPAGYLLDFENTPNENGYCISKDQEQVAGKPAIISFKYILKNANDNELYVAAIGMGEVFKDNSTGSQYLKKGEHTFTYSTDSFPNWRVMCVAIMNGSGTVSNADLYIWDVTINGNDTDIFNPDASQYCAHENVSISDVTVEELLYERNVNLIDFNQTPKGSGYALGDDTWGTEGKEVKISFDYVLNGAKDNEILIKSGGVVYEIADDTTGSPYLKNGRHTFTFTTNEHLYKCIYLLVVNNSDAASDADLYIWNKTVTVGDKDVSTPDPEYVDTTNVTYSTVSYSDVVDNSTAYEIDFAGKEAGNNFFVIGDDNYVSNASLEISFKYYLANAEDGELYVRDLATAGEFPNIYTNDGLLKQGRNNFKFKSADYSGSTCIALSVVNYQKASNAKLYIWDVEIIANGNNAFDTEGYQGCRVEGVPDFTTIAYKDVEYKGDANNDGTVNIIDFIRVKKYISNDGKVEEKNINLVSDRAIDSLDLAALVKLLLTNEKDVSEAKIVGLYTNGVYLSGFNPDVKEYYYYDFGTSVRTVSAVKTRGSGELKVTQATKMGEDATIELNGEIYTIKFRNAPDAYDAFYKLENGMAVLELTIDSGNADGETVEIAQLTDFHYNYCNEADFEENNPSTMSTYNNRTMNPNGECIPMTNACLEYAASFADQIVLTGDILDYLSYGALEVLKENVWDKYPGTLVALGNHDSVRVMGLPTDVADPSTEESRYAILQENWQHDVYYTSKVIKNKVMVIQLDNGTGKFRDVQVEQLQNDLTLARTNGYTVLLFMHVPLSTGKAEDSTVNAFYKGDGGYADFYKCIGLNSTGATKTVYDLITNNADVIKGVFTGHEHNNYYTEILAKTSDGVNTVIPQYTLSPACYFGGIVQKITVK